MNIGILTNMPTPYRTGLWKEYSKIDNVNIDYYYCVARENDRKWEVVKTEDVSEYFLNGITFGNNNHFNISIIEHFRKYDLWIIGGYSIPTCQMLILLCKIFKKPYVLMVDGINPHKLETSNNKLIDTLKKIYIQGQCFSFSSGTVGKMLMTKFGFDESKVYNQYLSVDIDWFIDKKDEASNFRSEIRNEFFISDKEIVLLYVGRIVKAKGIEDIILAANNLIEHKIPIKVLIVGDGEFKEEIGKKYLANEKIIFCGEIEYENLHKYYYSSDIFILPTYSDVWGLAINEAMACALPVITTTAAGAHLDLIENKNFVYKPGCVNSLTTSLYSALEFGENSNDLYNCEKLKIIGSENQMKIREYSYSNSRMELEKLLKRFENEKFMQ